jgi:hypothetical protein
MTDKVISMADFRKTEEQLETDAIDRTDIVLDYGALMSASYTLSHLAETGEVMTDDLIKAYELVAGILLQTMSEDDDELELEPQDD